MPTVYYDVSISDEEQLIQLLQQPLTYARKSVFKRTIAQSPITTIDLTSLTGGVAALWIKTDVPLNVTINGAATPLPVTAVLFVTISSLVTLVLAAVGATAANVEVVLWGG